MNVTAETNKGELISVDNATLTMTGRSSFYRNAFAAEGGAMIIASKSTVHLRAVLFRSNEYSDGGSGLSLSQGSNGTVDDVHFVDNKIHAGSCISVFDESDVHLRAVLFRSNEYSDGGSGLSLSQGSNGTVDDVHFVDNKIHAGSCISVFDESDVHLRAVLFRSNEYSDGGSGLSLSQGSNGTVDDVHFVDNKIHAGSCISVFDESDVHLRAVLFRSNEYSDGGSGLSLSQGSNGTVDDVHFVDNKIHAGSCISVFDESDVHLRAVLFRSNEYSDGGSGLSLSQGSNGTVDDVHFVDNKIHAGSCISVFDESDVHLRAVLFRSNEYSDGGSGLSLNQGSNGTVDDVHFVDNKIHAGSCISATRSRQLQIHASIFEENEVSRGSVVFVEGKYHNLNPALNISYTSFTKNVGRPSAKIADFGIQLQIWGFESGRVFLHSTTFSFNALDNQKGYYLHAGGDLAMKYSPNVDFRMTNCTFYANRLGHVSEMTFTDFSGNFFISKSRFLQCLGSAGVINFYDSVGRRSNLKIIDSVFQGNSAYRHNVRFSSVKSVHLERSNFTDNSVESFGSALLVDNADSVESNDCQISNNYLQLSLREVFFPEGAFCFHAVDSVVLNRSVFRNNSALTHDGGIGAAVVFDSDGGDAKLLVESCTFQKNRAIHGGGMYVAGYLSVTILSSTFLENSADGLGGAVFVDEGDLMNQVIQIMDSIFEDNMARIGGAISSRHSRLLFSGCSFVRNNATLYGGALALLRTPESRDSHVYRLPSEFVSFEDNRAAYGG